MCTPLPGNQANQDALDWIKLGGVDERVGTDVEKSDEHDDIIAAVEQCEVRVESRTCRLTRTSSHESAVENSRLRYWIFMV